MNNRDFAAKMRRGEYFHGLKMEAGYWSVLRVDGHGFSRLTETHFEKPFDERFHHAMLKTAEALLDEFQGLYAYTQSDEISVLLPPDWSLFDRGVEKAVSLSAGLASTRFSLACGHVAYFDSRIWQGETTQAVIDYFRWRQSDAVRCAINGSCYWALREARQSRRQVTKMLESQSGDEKKILLEERGLNFQQLPAWQRQGVGLFYERFTKMSLNPLTQENCEAQRRQIKIEAELPIGDDYAVFLDGIISDFEHNRRLSRG